MPCSSGHIRAAMFERPETDAHGGQGHRPAPSIGPPPAKQRLAPPFVPPGGYSTTHVVRTGCPVSGVRRKLTGPPATG